METKQSSLKWFFQCKRVNESLLRWSLWTGTVFCFVAGMVWVYSMRKSVDPYFLLAPTIDWGRPLGHPKGNISEGFDALQSPRQQELNDTAKSERVPDTHQDVDDGYLDRNTGIRGKRAVEQFRARAACLSNSGHWVYDPTPKKLPWLAVKEYNWVTKCDKRHTGRGGPGGIMGEKADSIALSNGSSGDWSVREELKWVWRTTNSSCPWHPMDRDDFCRRIGSNRNVLVVGDSISHEISVAIQNALSMNMSSPVITQQYASEEMCGDVLGGVGEGFSVNFIRNDYVSSVVNKTTLSRTHQNPWMPQLDKGEGDIKILVLNRGAHYEGNHKYVAGLRTTFELLRERHPELLVIYRNTPSGHVNCSQFQAPIDKPPKGAPRSFHWEQFAEQNQLARKLVEEFQYIYLDVARPIGMRPEGHLHGNDCLHYCHPGPLDLAVEMIYNVLLLLA